MEKIKKIFPEHVTTLSRVGIVLSMVIAVVALGFSLYVKPAIDYSSAKLIAKLTDKSNYVSRKTTGSLTFYSVDKDQVIYQGDEVFTDENASATITFLKSKNKVFLLSNSLIQIQDEEQEGINLKSGNAEVQVMANQSLIIVQNGQRMDLTNISNIVSTAIVGYSDGKVALTTEKGELQIKQGNKSEILKSSEKLTIDKKGIKKNHSLKVFSPKPYEKLSVEEPLKIDWESREKIMLTISKNKDFSNPVHEMESDKKSFTMPNLLPEGIYYIRLYAKGLDEKVHFSVSLLSRYGIDSLEPKNNEQIKLSRTDSKIKLSWSKVDTVGYKVTYSDVDNIEKEIDVKTNEAFINDLHGSEIRWKVSAKMTNGRYAPPSAESKFTYATILKNLLISPTQPNFYFEYGNIHFKWESSEGENFLIDIIDADSHFSLEKKEVTGNEYYFTPKRPGNYEMKLHSLTHMDIEDLSFKFTIQKQIATWKTKLNENGERYHPDDKIQLEFNIASEHLKNAVLEISDSPLFKNIMESLKINTPKLKYTLGNANQYCFRINSSVDIPLTGPSASQCAVISQNIFPKLPRPNEVTITRNSIGELNDFTFEVPKIDNATEYEFQVFMDPGLKDEVFKGKSNSNKLIWFNDNIGVIEYRRVNVSRGTFYYRYRVYNKYLEESDFSPAAKINLPISFVTLSLIAFVSLLAIYFVIRQLFFLKR